MWFSCLIRSCLLSFLSFCIFYLSFPSAPYHRKLLGENCERLAVLRGMLATRLARCSPMESCLTESTVKHVKNKTFTPHVLDRLGQNQSDRWSTTACSQSFDASVYTVIPSESSAIMPHDLERAFRCSPSSPHVAVSVIDESTSDDQHCKDVSGFHGVAKKASAKATQCGTANPNR